MKYFILLVVLLNYVSQIYGGLKSIEEVKDSITVISATPDRVRAYHVETWPASPADPRIVHIIGIDAQKTGPNSATLDAVAFALNTFLECSLGFAYFHAQAEVPKNGGNTTTSAAAGFAFGLRTFGLFEYVDQDGKLGYQNTTSSGDIVTGFYDLSNFFLAWKPIQFATFNYTATDGTVFTVFVIEIQTQDGVFKKRLTVAGYPIKVGQIALTPDSLKIDYEINWFNNPTFTGPTLYSTGPSTSPNAQVGLVGVVAAAAGVLVHNVPTTAQPSLTVSAGAFQGFFSYETVANTTVQGVAAAGAVYASVVDPNTQTGTNYNHAFAVAWVVKIFYFSFEGIRPENVVWDPEAGAEIDYSKLNGAGALMPSVMLMFVCLTYLISKRV